MIESDEKMIIACENLRDDSNVELLLLQGASIEGKKGSEMTPLTIACKFGNIRTAKSLLDHGANINAKTTGYNFYSNGFTPLIIACANGQTGCAGLLIGRGAHIDLMTSLGMNAIHWAAVKGYHEIIPILLSKPEYKKKFLETQMDDEDGHTPLQIAIKEGHKIVVGVLLDYMTPHQINIKNRRGRTSLHEAASMSRYGTVRIIKSLIEAGADINALSDHGETALAIAYQSGVTDVIECLNSLNALDFIAGSSNVSLQSPAQISVMSSTPILFFNTPIKSHQELLLKFQNTFSVAYNEIYSGTVVEQCLVGIAGIYTSQKNSFFRREQDQTTYFQLSFFNEEELNIFIKYYENFVKNFIINHEKISENIYKVKTNTTQLYNYITIELGKFHQTSHQKLIDVFQAELNTTQNEVLCGTVVEENLVKSAGINRNQDGAIFRRENNYATYFNLRLQPQEQRTFCRFYQNKYPGIILEESRQHGSEWVKITMNTKLLQSEVARDLGEQVVANNSGRRPRV